MATTRAPMATGLYDAEISKYEASTRHDPECVEAWLGLGECTRKAGLAERSLRCFQRALVLAPELVDAWVGRAAAQNDLSRPLHALQATDEACDRDPKHAGAWFERGRSLHALGRLPSAVEAFERVIELEPSNMGAWTLRGICQRGVRRVRCEMGITRPRAAILKVTTNAMSPEDVAEHWSVSTDVAKLAVEAAVLTEHGEFAAAIERLRESTEKDPEFVWAWRSRARCQQFLRRFDEAIECYTRAFDLEANAEDLEGVGNCQLAKGEIDDALRTFGRAIAKCPSLADAWYGQSLAFEACGKSAAALRAYDKFIELASANASARADRGHSRDVEARRRLTAHRIARGRVR